MPKRGGGPKGETSMHMLGMKVSLTHRVCNGFWGWSLLALCIFSTICWQKLFVANTQIDLMSFIMQIFDNLSCYPFSKVHRDLSVQEAVEHAQSTGHTNFHEFLWIFLVLNWCPNVTNSVQQSFGPMLRLCEKINCGTHSHCSTHLFSHKRKPPIVTSQLKLPLRTILGSM